jgi:hypothetical protein
MTLVFPHLALPTTSSLHVATGTPLRTAAAWRESREADPKECFYEKRKRWKKKKRMSVYIQLFVFVCFGRQTCGLVLTSSTTT